MKFEKSFDVLVAGAGVAGVAAALECARVGLHTALVEKTVFVGGLATAGLINIYLPLCDGLGHQVTYGIAEELLHLSLRYGPGDVPAGWREGRGRYQTPFSPATFVLALDEVLADAGVALWLDTLFCQPVMYGERTVGLEVENKSGRGVLRARCVIDATGDADVAFRAGAPCAEANNWLSLWAIQASYAKAQQVVAQPDKTSLLDCIRLGGDAWGHGISPDVAKFYGTDGAQVTRFILESRRLLREHYAAQHAAGGDTDRHKCFPVTLPAMAQLRTTRHIVGQATLSDGQAGIHVSTSVGLVPDWRKPGPVWEIPYGALLPRGVTGLLVAGRCISSVGDAWEVTRVIPPAALTGQVAGVAARLAISGDTTPDAVDVRDVQRELARAHIPLHIGDVC